MVESCDTILFSLGSVELDMCIHFLSSVLTQTLYYTSQIHSKSLGWFNSYIATEFDQHVDLIGYLPEED